MDGLDDLIRELLEEKDGLSMPELLTERLLICALCVGGGNGTEGEGEGEGVMEEVRQTVWPWIRCTVLRYCPLSSL